MLFFLDRYWDIGLDLIRDGIIELDIIMGIFLINMKEGNSDGCDHIFRMVMDVPMLVAFSSMLLVYHAWWFKVPTSKDWL